MRILLSEFKDYDSLYFKTGYTLEATEYDNFNMPAKANLVDRKTNGSYKVRRGSSYYSTKLAYFCSSCGAELLGDWKWFDFLPNSDLISDAQEKDDTWEAISCVEDLVKAIVDEEFERASNLQICPCCGGALSHEQGYYVSSDGTNDPTVTKKMSNGKEYQSSTFEEYRTAAQKQSKKKSYDYFDFMKDQRKELDNDTAKKNAESFVAGCNIPVPTTVSKETVQKIKTDSENLKDYINNLLKTELNIYALEKLLPRLYYLQISSKREAQIGKILPILEELQAKKCECETHIKNAEDIKNKPLDLMEPLRPTEPEMKKAGLFNKKKVEAENATLLEKYQAELKNYQDQMVAYEKRKEQLKTEKERLIANELAHAESIQSQIRELQNEANKPNTDKVSPASFAMDMVTEEVVQTESLLKSLYECKNKMYSYDIIFSKYRNVVSLSTFYEYLMAGRCVELEGANGAYNIYENEVRSNLIIGQLSQVIEKLENIQKNQYLIYSEINSINKNLEKLNTTMETALTSIQKMERNVSHIAQNSDVIAHNSAVTAYYSKVNAELTNALGYLVAFK